MSWNPNPSDQADRKQSEDLRVLSTDVLIRRIAYDGDRAALAEFHNHRRLFRCGDGPLLLLVDFVAAVYATGRRVRAFGLPTEVLDRAYDLTIDKFLRLPANPPPGDGGADGHTPSPLKRDGTDCRHYFRIMAESIDARQREQPQPDPLAREAATARIVQHRVAFHCWWSCLEACRGLRRAWSRFIWRLPDGNIRLWLPRRLPASRRRGWLECHVPDASPQRQGERQRIQAVIDSLFGFADVLFFEEGLHAPMAPRTGSVLDWLVQCEVAEHGLAEFVAREKSARIAEQRPAVRRLGRARVKALIHRVFDELEADNKEDYAIAQAFGLSRATFSRFAGRRWKWNNHRSVPDLWLNVAAIADRFPHFRELASSSGVLDRIEAIARFRSNGGPFDGR